MKRKMFIAIILICLVAPLLIFGAYQSFNSPSENPGTVINGFRQNSSYSGNVDHYFNNPTPIP